MREAGTAGGEFRSRLEAALELVRPALRFDGGDVELLEVEGQSARVRFIGSCAG
jgi:Fe-S cluster biogenesis protein NfuA